MFEFNLPSLGSDMDKGTLLQWKVEPGQAVAKGDVVAVVDTSKAAVDVEIWSDGTVQELLVEIGQEIPVGTPIIALSAPGEAAPAKATRSKKAGKAAPEVKAAKPGKPGKPGKPAEPTATAGPAASAAAPARATGLSPPGPSGGAVAAEPSRQRVSPVARRRAGELGLDLARVTGTGAQGAVTLDDVEQAAAIALAAVAAAAPASLLAPTRVTGAPVDRNAEMRRAIAAAMTRSKREIPHYYLCETIPMRKALDWMRGVNAKRPVTERILPAALLLKAVALATRDFPEMNGLYIDGAYRPSPVAHIGVAISLRKGGLIAPALHDVGGRELDTVMLELADLVRRCRGGSLRSSEMSDPTITVTNLGDQGVQQVFGVIYPPQVALVGFGRIAEQPWVEGGKAVVMPVVSANLSADHRVSDGHRGALFLARLAALLQQPETL